MMDSEPDQTIRAVIIGASGGIGRALCDRIAKSGGDAFLIGRDGGKISEVASRYGWGYAIADAANWEEIDRQFSSAEGILGGINAVVNLAGSVLLKPIHLTSQSEWDDTLRANVTTAAGAIRAGVSRMMYAGGSIVLCSSAAAQIGLQNHEAIAAAKGGIESLVRSAAATYAYKAIRVNAVAPGLVKTPLTQRIWKNEKAADFSKALHPLARLGTPEDIASALFWLISPEQTWVTGQVIGVDGGLASLKIARPAVS